MYTPMKVLACNRIWLFVFVSGIDADQERDRVNGSQFDPQQGTLTFISLCTCVMFFKLARGLRLAPEGG